MKIGFIALALSVFCLLYTRTVEVKADARKNVSEDIDFIILKADVDGLKGKLETIEELPSNSIYLDIGSKNFSPLQTSLGIIYVSLQDVKEYGNGYQIVLHIGNPTGFYLQDASMKIKWGRRADLSDPEFSFEKWSGSLREKEESIPGAIEPFKWNRKTITLTPADKDELEYLKLSVDFASVTPWR